MLLTFLFQLADAVLLDAPCTATGTLRRHPDAGLLKSAGDVARMAEVQARLGAAGRMTDTNQLEESP